MLDLKTDMAELIWDGKYRTGPDGGRVKQGPIRVALPFQTIETVNESTQERQKALDIFSHGGESAWRNRLIWGDKKYVLPSLLTELGGKIDLIYIDPPFDTGSNFSFSRQIPDADSGLEYEPNAIEQKAYRDTWGNHPDSYCQWLYDTAVLLRELLSPDGSLYLHIGINVGHYAKLIFDEVFGPDRFINELIWKRQSAKSGAFEGIRQYGRIHESIFYYSKSDKYKWRTQYTEYDPEYTDAFYKHVDPTTGRRYRLSDLTAAGARKGESGSTLYIDNKPYSPAAGRHWALGLEQGESVQQALDRLVRDGRINVGKSGITYKRFLDEMPGVALQDVWTDIPPVSAFGGARVEYATQKPEALLQRIITASSNVGDLVLDCFCGSGTTAVAAEKLGRRWITCDLGRFAIHTARKRLLSNPDIKPFVVQNLGKYERQQWQVQEFGEASEEKLHAYRSFILSLYRSRELSGNAWLHGVKAGRMVHVGSVDSPISAGDVKQIATEFRKAIGTGIQAPTTSGVDVLGWDFAFDLNETAKVTAQQAGIDMRFVVIPREVLEKKAVEQGDIHFYELAAFALEAKVTGKKLTLELKDFMMSLEDVPQDVQVAVKHWSQWIDYWAVDFDFKGDTFHNEWQSYRTRKEPKLITGAEHKFEVAGNHTVMVKVIDILGNDTTKTLKVEVK